MNPKPPYGIVQTVRAELATPGRYQLAVRVHRSLFAEAWEWIAARWNAFWASLTRHITLGRGEVTLIGDVMLAVCTLAIVIVAIHILVRIELESAQRAGAVPLERPRSAQAYAISAAAAAADGDYARAVRLLFIAAVTLLDLRGLVHDERSSTINELRREVRQRDAALEPPFLTLARAYTSAAYAEEPLGEDTWERAQDAYSQLRAYSGA